MRRAVITLTALLGSMIFMLGVGATTAWAEGEGVQGTLRHDREPVAGVTISVYTEDEQLIEQVQTAADGTWFVAVPGAGTYLVELDTSTLPDGVRPRTGSTREREVFAGNVSPVLFPLQGRTGPAPPPPPPGQSPTPGEDDGIAVPGEGEEEPDGESDVARGTGRFGTVLALTYSGLHFGLYIALAALGLSLIFGTMGLTNFSHGELVTFGAIMGLMFNIGLGLPVLVAAPFAVALGALFGYAQDRFFWGWLRKRGTGLIAMMIISIGVALMLRFAYLYFIGGETSRYNEYVVQQTIRIGQLTVVPKTLISDAIAITVLVSVGLALLFTRFGKAIRAVADNPALAAASGINVDRIIRLVWALGGGLAALAGVILAIDQGVHYQMGLRILLLIFAAVVLGGLGTAFGALVGSLVVGLFIQLSTLWIPGELKYTGALAILIVVLLVRPQGILGRRERIG